MIQYEILNTNLPLTINHLKKQEYVIPQKGSKNKNI